MITNTTSSFSASSPPAPPLPQRPPIPPSPSASLAATLASLDGIDATARSVYRRARASGPAFADVAGAVRDVHTMLKHLRVEANDPDSLLNPSGAGGSGDGAASRTSVYARQLRPLIEDCDFELQQLDALLERYGKKEGEEGEMEDGVKDKIMDQRDRDMLALIRTRLANQKTNLNLFLNMVQLRNRDQGQRMLGDADADTKAEPPSPSLPPRPQAARTVEEDARLDDIKRKVDAVAERLFRKASSSRDGGPVREADEDMWLRFKRELEREGFSSTVLTRNKVSVKPFL